MKIAVVLTVKNESRLLRDNLRYHYEIGVSKAFVYFDGTTDDGKETIKDFDFVDSQDSVNPEVYKNLDYLNKFTSQAEEHHTARQCLNTYDALQKSKALGFDWLISIDADELIATQTDKRSNLKTFFNNQDDSVDVINFRTLEVLQQQEHFENVFAEADLFKTRKNFKYRGESIFRKIYNPSLQKFDKHYYWYGQTMGKGAIRINSDLIPHNVHRYIHKNDDQPKNINDGYVLHYHAYDAEDFIKKFRNFSQHPEHFLSGNRVESLKLLLKDVVNNQGYSEVELKEYFKNNLLFTSKNIKKLSKNKKLFFLKRRQSAVKQVVSVVKTFDEIKYLK
ncbi:glycosyltransferase family 2 protein [Psychroserpens damuponensis]|uniref:glycosyltransferase family 2 protein n=1 Tax=Psychroserpens damuponensis TaxID=943936 RepID=UPI00058D1139|nr:glycosyltransferase family 2 protein [Psychroserpens damuponensis]